MWSARTRRKGEEESRSVRERLGERSAEEKDERGMDECPPVVVTTIWRLICPFSPVAGLASSVHDFSGQRVFLGPCDPFSRDSPSHRHPVLIRIPSPLIDNHRDPILPIRLFQVRTDLARSPGDGPFLVEAGREDDGSTGDEALLEERLEGGEDADRAGFVVAGASTPDVAVDLWGRKGEGVRGSGVGRRTGWGATNVFAGEGRFLPLIDGAALDRDGV